MQKTTIYFDDEMALGLRHRADEDGRSQAEIIRAAIRNYLGQSNENGRRVALPPGVGCYRSGRSDVSEKAEEILCAAVKKAEWP